MMLELSAENYISKQCADASHSLGIYIYNNVYVLQSVSQALCHDSDVMPLLKPQPERRQSVVAVG